MFSRNFSLNYTLVIVLYIIEHFVRWHINVIWMSYRCDIFYYDVLDIVMSVRRSFDEMCYIGIDCALCIFRRFIPG